MNDHSFFRRPPTRPSRRLHPGWLLAGALVGVGLLALAARALWPPPAPETSLPTPSPTAPATPAFSLTGRLVFVAGPPEQEDIYVANADGTGLTNLTRRPADYDDPAWSPDGRQIAFASDFAGPRCIYVMDADGTQVTPVPHTGPLDVLAGWSPDGRWLLLTSYRDVNGEIYAIRADGSQVSNLTHDPAEDESPAWSPNGAQIAFASDRDTQRAVWTQQVYVMNLDGTGLTRLTDSFDGAAHPVWSPDGQHIAFSRAWKTSFGGRIVEDVYVMRSDGSEPRQVTALAGLTRPRSWSPDGRRLLANREWETAEGVQYEALILSPFDDDPPVALPNPVAAAGWGHCWLHPALLHAALSVPDLSPPEPPQPGSVVLVNGTLIDGTGADPVPAAVVVVQDGRIAAVGPRAQVAIPASVPVIDVRGGAILPGFINAHVHEAYEARNLEAWAWAGVTTVRDLNAPSSTLGGLQSLYAFRDVVLRHPRYARVVAASPMMTAPGGYGVFVVDSPADARQKTAAAIAAGADVIKISLEDALGNEALPVLSAEEVQAIVSTAHERSKRVSAHVSRASQLERAVAAGVDDAAHMVTDPLPADVISRTVAAGVVCVPTLEVWRAAGLDWNATSNLRRFVAAGGQVALGTDYAGADLRMELGMPIHEILWLQEAGLTPMQIIVAATRNAARVCGQERTLGTLEVGKIADILVVDGDPLADLLALTHVRLVLRDGVVIRQ